MEPKHPDFRHPEIIATYDDQVVCDGGGGPIGHPRIYMPLYEETGFVDCPYCDRRFVKAGGDIHSDSHSLTRH